MNIRLLDQVSGTGSRLIVSDEYTEENVARANEEEENKSFICASSYWTVQYGLAASALKNDSEFDVDENATKAQIKRAFTKSLKGKKMNKKILSSFIEQIA